MRSYLTFLSLSAFISLVPLLSGCEPAPPPREDLGNVVSGLPKVPGADKPYEMPEIDKPEKKPPSGGVNADADAPADGDDESDAGVSDGV